MLIYNNKYDNKPIRDFINNVINTFNNIYSKKYINRRKHPKIQNVDETGGKVKSHFGHNGSTCRVVSYA